MDSYACFNYLMITIELAKCADMKDIYQVGKECLPIYYQKRDIVEFILDEKAIVLKAMVDNKVAGYVIGNERSKSNFHINTFAVSHIYRRRGIGKQLIVDIIKRGTSDFFRNIDNITLYVQTVNVPAISLYKSVGFGIEKELTDYYWEGGHAYEMKFNVAK